MQQRRTLRAAGVEQDLDPRPVQRVHQRLELGHL
jgi:hypothetical protein